MSTRVLQIHPADNALVALLDLPEGTTVEFNGLSIRLPQMVPAKHKFVTQPLAVGDPVIMYGVLVGKAVQSITQGELITPFNLQHQAEPYSLENRQPWHWQPPDVSDWQSRTFQGYVRSDSRVGTRNYWLVVPLVFCENRNIRKLQEAFEQVLGYGPTDTYRQQLHQLAGAYRQSGQSEMDTSSRNAHEPTPVDQLAFFPNVDGIKFLTHDMGCGGTNADADRLCELLAGFITNPNVGGVTVLSLGCQKSQLEGVKGAIQKRIPDFDRPILYFDQQTYGTESAMLTEAIKQTFQGLIQINEHRRHPVPLSTLTIGLKCGGSDGFSGISANPALGHLSDLLVTLGGTTILAEFPELCGVEQEMINRSVDETVASRFLDLINEYARQAAAVGAGFDMNPSVGNIRDGLITDAIKSAGAAKKGGYAPITDVLDYTEPARKPGLHLLCTPGNDVLATTGMAASGATLILFTTGLGTPTGNPITPTIKISTHTRLATRMPDIIDFDAGPIISGQETIAQTSERLLDWIIGLASGEYRTKAEQLAQDDFIPWQRGVNL